jgi:anti-sigma regulatory factor (Ser/Thr protein kinase)
MGSIADTSVNAERPRKLQLILPARSENVVVIRHALAGLAEEIGMDEAGLADLKTVVTEACTNVVLHAYRGEAGPLSVEAEADEAELTVVVRDKGVGIRPQADSDRESLRLGLSLIAALSSSFAISGGTDRGTEVTMRVPLRGGGRDGKEDPVEVKPAAEASSELIVDRSELLGPVLARVIGALAARRALSVERISDAVLITDALAAAASQGFSDGRVRLGLEEDDAGFGLRLGPMEAGAGDRIRRELELPDIGGSLEKLADSLSVEESDDGEYLVIRFESAVRR